MHGILRGLFYRREERDDGTSVIYPKYHWPMLFGCGHTGPGSYHLEIEGMTFSNKIVDPTGKGPCADCSVDEFLKRVIRCVGCGKPIVPQQKVAIIDVIPGDAFKPGAHFVNGGKQVILCCGPTCSLGEYSGFWNGESIDRPKNKNLPSR